MVVRCCEQARRASITPGLTLAHAQALCPTLHVERFSWDKNHKLLRRVGEWALQFSPLVSLDIPEPHEAHAEDSFDNLQDGITIDITGSTRLWRGEQNLLLRVHAALQEAGLTARCAIAPTRGAAWALSRYGIRRSLILEENQLLESLAPLPVEALRIVGPTAEALHEVQITKLGQLVSLPPESLAARFGPELVTRLQQALGHEPEVIAPLRTTSPLIFRRDFAYEVGDRELLIGVALELLDEALTALRAEGRHARHFALLLEQEKLPAIQQHIPLSLATSQRKHLQHLFRSRMEALNIPAGITAISLAVLRNEATTPLSLDIEPRQAAPSNADFGMLLDTLIYTLGERNVLGLRLKDSHLPERSFEYQAPTTPTVVAPLSPYRAERDRPSVMFTPPRQIRALSLLPDKPPYWLQWDNRPYRVATGLGPERISNEWWESSPSCSRDYFKVQLQSGVWLWVFRELETSRWFLHGLWA